MTKFIVFLASIALTYAVLGDIHILTYNVTPVILVIEALALGLALASSK